MPWEEPAMKFRLTYEGSVRPSQNDPKDGQPNRLAAHKHGIRRAFHGQLRQLWATDRFLREDTVWPKDWGYDQAAAESVWGRWAPNPNEKAPLKDAIAVQFQEYGYRFVPLVLDKFSLLCSLEILFLRRDFPGSVLSAGDIDNRVKTVIDCLRRPINQMDLVGDDATPKPDEDPFFCLLEDDKQVSRLIVETDRLLDPEASDDVDHSKAKLVITVELRPYYTTMFNLSFAS